ncbi:MAG: hypothetical protein A2068_11370 [Ignavibacteria bacterium GWB2_35_6b]|nr:MAG: hypothetical protein A2068_11370 [Ignavibacteria bacterium GWB2_35_6b]
MKKLFVKTIIVLTAVFTLYILIKIIFPSPQPLTELGNLYLITAPENQPGNFDERIFDKLLSGYSYELKFADSNSVLNSIESLIQNLKNSSLSGSWENQLITLNPPIEQSKKILRAEIESAFRGENLRNALRSIIPVLALENLNSKEDFNKLDDNIIYLSDNFGGIGFWVDKKNMKKLISKLE